MEESPKGIELSDELLDLIVKRLLQKAEHKTVPPNPSPRSPQSTPLAAITPTEVLPTLLQEGEGEETSELVPAEFAKVEKNLASLGFFTPSSKRIKEAKAKTINITAVVNGHRVDAKATIVPAALYGLPITADQDKFLALQKFITDLRQRQGGQVANPISFSSAELLQLLQQADAGKNYREIDEWLNVMASTMIISEGAVYLAGKKRWVKDRFHVFDRAVSFGKELEPGVTADRNYVWLSDWQLENINSNHLIPIDLETYRQLHNHIAKTLVPLLQIWLFASRKEGSFEKRYEELCQILSIRQYYQISRIKEQLGPSLDELTQHGYLAGWQAEKTTDDKAYKIILRHGEKFHRDRRRRLAQNPTAALSQAPASDSRSSDPTAPAATQEKPQTRRPRQARLNLQHEIEPALLAELAKRGIGEGGARKLLSKLPLDRPVLDLLEWGDAEVGRQPGKITNPAGFYIRLLEEHSAPPPTFETSAAKAARQRAESAKREAIQQQRQAALETEDAARRLADAQLAALPPEAHQALLDQAKAEIFREHPFMATQKNASAIHEGAIRARMRTHLANGWKFVPPLSEQPPTGVSTGRPVDLQTILSTPQLPPSAKQKQPS